MEARGGCSGGLVPEAGSSKAMACDRRRTDGRLVWGWRRTSSCRRAPSSVPGTPEERAPAAEPSAPICSTRLCRGEGVSREDRGAGGPDRRAFPTTSESSAARAASRATLAAAARGTPERRAVSGDERRCGEGSAEEGVARHGQAMQRKNSNMQRLWLRSHPTKRRAWLGDDPLAMEVIGGIAATGSSMLHVFSCRVQQCVLRPGIHAEGARAERGHPQAPACGG